MNHPTIRACVFEPEMDKAINTALLRAIFEEFGVKYDPESDSFTSPLIPWGIMVEDQHDDREVEPEPHYILKVGEGNFETEDEKSYETRYCDYKSTTNIEEDEAKKEKKQKKEDPLGIILTNPGKWTIHVWLPKKYASLSEGIAKRISGAYAEVMSKILPDYFIPSSDNFIKVD